MSFGKSAKDQVQQSHFNPPPGYYEPEHSKVKVSMQGAAVGSVFNKGNRFKENKLTNFNPGPGSYMNKDKQIIRKRLLDEVSHKEDKGSYGNRQKGRGYSSNGNSNSDIKISSIPSIPKKSATRVYEQLAPGILILHEQENEDANIGPGSYNINENIVKKKITNAKFAPEHVKKKRLQSIEQEGLVHVPTMGKIFSLNLAQQLRQQKRMLYKQHLIKSSNVNKSDINSSDLCLETIILREKLLRGEQLPPPGHYYNANYLSAFALKQSQLEKPQELQALGGRQQRFRDRMYLEKDTNIGPGSYQIKEEVKRIGGVINKNLTDEAAVNDFKRSNEPGPGAYQIISMKNVNHEVKGNYPPIFGSGTKRFASAPKTVTSQSVGPGLYKIDRKRHKKTKYIKIRKDFYESQPATKKDSQFSNTLNMGDISQQFGQKGFQSDSFYSGSANPSRKQKNNHYFKSKVQRFLGHDKRDKSLTGPGQYETSKSSFSSKNTFNRIAKTHGYLGDKSQRFQDRIVRPNLGPGVYYENKQKE